MIRTKIQAQMVPIRGLMPLMFATLFICVVIVILMQLMTRNSRNAGGCAPEMLKTPAF